MKQGRCLIKYYSNSASWQLFWHCSGDYGEANLQMNSNLPRNFFTNENLLKSSHIAASDFAGEREVR